MEVDSHGILNKILSEEERDGLPGEVKNKLDKFFEERLEELLTSKAVFESGRKNYDEKISELENKLSTVEEQHETDKKNLEIASQNINELEKQVESYRGEVTKLHETCARAEHDSAEFKRQRDAAVDERDNLLKMVERRTTEVARLQMDVTTLTEQLQTAVNSKCEALAKCDEVESMKMSLEYREKRMEKERILLNNQIQNLNEDLNKRVEELMNIRREHTTRLITLQTSLDEKTEELRVAQETIKSLTEINNDITANAEKLTEKLKEQRDDEAKYHESFSQELQAQTKLAELYKGMLDDNKGQSEQLTNGIGELQKLLNEATEQYGDLETKYNAEKTELEEILVKKNECIEILKKELEEANDLLNLTKDQKLESMIDTPTGSKLFKSGTTITQIYSQYMSTSEELLLKESENRRLNTYIDTIVSELEEKAPILKKQREDYEIALNNLNVLTKQYDALVMENQNLRENNAEANKNASLFQRENERLKQERADLSRQVCYLLKELEDLRSSSISSHDNDTNTSDYHSSSDIISKRLVTFSDIEELQQNNQKLLALVRELSNKQEEAETMNPAEIAELQEKLESMRETQTELLESQERQTKMLNTVIRQRDTYKKLYSEAMRQSVDITMEVDQTSGEPGDISVETVKTTTPRKETSPVIVQNTKELEEVQAKLSDIERQYRVLREEYDNYRKERNTNESMLNEQLDNLRTEHLALTQSNCKLVSLQEYNEERFKILKSNTGIYKNQIESLEKKNDIYNTTIVKHEQTIMHLKDEILNAHSKLSRAEVMLENLQQENKLLKDSEARLMRERDSLNRETRSQSILLNNLESIKASLERSEAEGKIRLETRFDEATRECSALRRRLQEEQDRFRELATHLERQTNVAKERMEEERSLAMQLRKELDSVREEVVSKSNHIEDLTRKLKGAMILGGTEPSVESKKIKDLENKLNESQMEIKTLKQQLIFAKEQVSQYSNVSESAEKELKQLHDVHTSYKKATDAKIQAYVDAEKQLNEKIKCLEAELTLESNDQRETTIDLRNRLTKSETELENIRQELEKTKSEFDKLLNENKSLNANIQQTEEKYAREMLLHSADIQALGNLKEELNKIVNERNELVQAKEEAIEALKLGKESWEKQIESIKSERTEIENRIADLDKQNSVLHNQIEALSTQLSVAHAQTGSETPLNQSIGDSSMNRSLTEDDVKSSDQLLQVIKYLRREKDIAVARFDIITAENARLKSEIESMQKQFNEAKQALNTEREKSDVAVVTSNKHSEVLRKVETLNAITDSNRILREERDTLLSRINDLSNRTTRLEEDIAPLQEKNQEMQQKLNTLQSDNAALRGECTKWRQRANQLVEKANKTGPEDWRRLQQERENLAKMLMTEKENVRVANQEKQKVVNQLQILQKQQQLQTELLKKKNEELVTIKQQITKVAQELNESKAQANKLTEENNNLKKELETKEEAFNILKSKEIDIRKIAQKYKTMVVTDKKTYEDKIAELTNAPPPPVPNEVQEQYREEGRKEINERISTLEKTHKEKMDEISAQVTSSQEENNNLKKENEQLKQEAATKYERSQTVLRNAKAKIQNLSEKNNELNKELAELRSRGGTEDSSDDRTVELRNKIIQLEKEKSELLAEKKQERERHTRELESLNQRLAQLQRQVQQKPSASSGPVEKGTSEPPTANIKPLPGHSGQSAQQNVIRIRPMSVPSRAAAAVFPQNVSSAAGPSTAILVPQQQQIVHTTGSDTISASPTSSHTDYMPATSSAASPTVAPIRQVAVPPTQQSIGIVSRGDEHPSPAESTQDTEADVTEGEQRQSPQQQQQQCQQAVAMVLPRVETQQTAEQSSAAIASSQAASSSNTVTTTQAGLKRMRDNEGDSSTGGGQDEPRSDVQPQAKRTRLQPGVQDVFQGVTESGIEVEYQVPTSSQRDQEDDVIVVDSEDDAEEEEEEEEEGPDEGDALDEPDENAFEDTDNGEEGYEEEGFDQEQELAGYDEEMDEEEEDGESESPVRRRRRPRGDDEDNNEVEIIDDEEEEEEDEEEEDDDVVPDAPNQSGNTSSTTGNSSGSTAHIPPVVAGTSTQSDGASQSGSADGTGQQQQNTGGQSEAISSAGNDGSGTSYSQRRNVTPLTQRQQQLMLQPHGYEDAGDDGIVPSTPTLYVPRRTDGFSEAVSSPHVPTGGRFTFNDPPIVQQRGSASTSSATASQTGQSECTDDQRGAEPLDETGTGRSVPTTPLQVSPQGGDQVPSDAVDIGAAGDRAESGGDVSTAAGAIIPTISVTADDNEQAGPSSEGRATGSDVNAQGDVGGVRSEGEEQDDVAEIEEQNDGITSEGEKSSAVEDTEMEEGREAEATSSPSCNTRASARRSLAGPASRIRTRTTQHYARMGGRGGPGRPTPIVWNDQQGGGYFLPGNRAGGHMGGPPRAAMFQRGGPPRARRMRRR